MMTSTLQNPAQSRQGMDGLMQVYAAARRLMLHRERARALQARLDRAPDDLAEAIDRDFIEFDLMRAERRLRDALRAAEPLLGNGNLLLDDDQD
ncbi:hypothetical protein [Teichococcus vastitatis]|uniref:Uncharacterized protein n=1 Tax=Teichococcus vastitatis TaxID=2307076 RepID=A0ABS9W5Q9_9PROT|nr:hypothetical protein [Pseudoroseomonas vastitatis]MCI0754617.1 hypothetical protein [Pseudoroseomonas vastitatis]